jgi:hypothetical protein
MLQNRNTPQRTSTGTFLWMLAGLLLAVFFASATSSTASDDSSAEESASDVSFSPYAGRDFPTQAFFGDTHVHTSVSMDAGAIGNRLGPEDAYRFARGEEVTSSTGVQAKLSRPLDFIVVSDHSDNMGLFELLNSANPVIVDKSKIAKELSDKIRKGGKAGMEAGMYIVTNFANNELDESLEILPGSEPYQTTWKLLVDAAEKYNDPGRFTAFIGYEWTSLIKGGNMHRNVIYRDGGELALQVEPYTTTPPLGSPNPRDLWKWLAMYEEKTGGDVLAIAHNGNLSNGIMFPEEAQFDGTKLDKEYVKQRIQWEPLYEVTQMKGDGEAHPFLSPDDEFADYETWDLANLNLSTLKEDSMLAYEYSREALKIGLRLEEKLEINPYKFGVIGSTDTHTSLATAQEDNFFGKHSGTEPGPQRIDHVVLEMSGRKVMGWEQAASGLAVIWAKENSRESLYDAMNRKETYATTGSRMRVRFFGSWSFTEDDALERDLASVGYGKGVPMGGDLTDAPSDGSPSFLVAALKDPLSGNLDRIQVVKGWMDAEGELHERIYDVAVSDGRKIGRNGRCKKAVGNTVDVERATWTNSIGASELVTVWQDPEFDPKQSAVYYARVIEIPTPRWTAYEAKRYSLKTEKEVPMTTQERAYTSPIWYTP